MLENQFPSVCFVSTIAWPLRVYLGPHIREISTDCQVSVIADGVFDLDSGSFPDGAVLYQLEIPRKIRLWKDLVAFYRLWRIFRSNRFHCVHSIMPKAGLLSMLAAFAAGVPARFHTFTGQVWATQTGFKRRLLILSDWLICLLSTRVLADSPSQRDFLILNGVVRPDKIIVLGPGSIAGVDICRFAPNSLARITGRKDFGIDDGDVVFLFIGRLNYDKGVIDLINAFLSISIDWPVLRLLLVGPDEGCDSYINGLSNFLRQRILRVDFTWEPEKFMAMSDVICLPSYREGFGSVLVEGAAMGLPAIASRIYGIQDAVVDGVTGLLHEPKNVSDLAHCMRRLALDERLRLEMSVAGRDRVVKEFSEELLTSAFRDFYCENLLTHT